MGKVMLRAWCFGGGNGSSSHVPKASVHAESVQRIWNKAGKIPVPHRTAVFLLSPGLLWSSAFRVGDPLHMLRVGKTHTEVSFALLGQSMHGGSAGASLLPLKFYLLHPHAQYLSLTIVFIQPNFRHSRETPKLGMKSFLGSEGAWIST